MSRFCGKSSAMRELCEIAATPTEHDDETPNLLRAHRSSTFQAMFRRIHENFQIVDRCGSNRGVAAGGFRRRQRQAVTPTGTATSSQFDTLDTNRDGRISPFEAANDTKIVFSTADKNGDGYLDSSEYMHRTCRPSRCRPTRRRIPTAAQVSRRQPDKPAQPLWLRGPLFGRHACGNALKLRSRACDYGRCLPCSAKTSTISCLLRSEKTPAECQ